MTNDNGNCEESPAAPIPEDMEINEAERERSEERRVGKECR